MNSAETPVIENPGPESAIDDQARYILSPLFRLRNAKDHAVLYGAEGIVLKHVHKAVAIVLSLCNGERTVSDIARITRPLVKISDDQVALKWATRKTKAIIAEILQDDERQGRLAANNGFSESACLVSPEAYKEFFKRTNVPTVEYNAKDFLPKEAIIPDGFYVRVRRNEVPVSLNWHFTSECTTDCKYCYLGRRHEKIMDKDRVLSLIDEAGAMGVLAISANGGDILLYPHLQDVLLRMRHHKMLPVMLSSKSFLSKSQAKMLADTGMVWSLQFSIDSTIPEVADYLVGAKNYVNRIMTSIDNALEAGLHVGAKSVITPYNILTIPRLYRELKQKGVGIVRMTTYVRSGFHHSDELFNHKESFDWLQEEFQKLRKDFPTDNLNVQNGPPTFENISKEDREKAWANRAGCSSGRSSMMICADGKVIPCEQMPQTEEYFCGDLTQQSIAEVWNGARLREMTYGIPREKFKGTACYDCDEREQCQNEMGNCIRDLSFNYGHIFQPPPNCPKFERPFLRQL